MVSHLISQGLSFLIRKMRLHQMISSGSFQCFFSEPNNRAKYKGLKTQSLFSDNGVDQLAGTAMVLHKVSEGVGARKSWNAS